MLSYNIPSEATPRSGDEYGEDRNLTVVEVAAGRVSDVNMASRKAEEAVARRFQAVSWINKIIGCIRVPPEPSEDALRLCLRNGALLCRLMNRIEPGAVSKVVETTSSDGSLSAFQCFENLRNFLVAAQELKLPTFEISDLEQVTGSMTKVVDCILALKSYNEWKQTGALGSWKYAGSLRSPIRGNVYPRGHGRQVPSDLTFKKNSRKRLLPPDNYAEAQQPLAEEPTGLVGSKGHSVCYEGHLEDDPASNIENCPVATDSTSAWINHLAGKLREVLQLKPKPLHESAHGNHAGLNGFEGSSFTVILKTVLAGKQADEVPALVELMIKKVVEEFQQRLQAQGEQVANLKHCVNATFPHEEKSLKSKEMEQLLAAAKTEIESLRYAFESAKEETFTMQQQWKTAVQSFESQVLELAADAAGYRKALAENRKLYNEVQDLKGSIRVYCRVRPSSDAGNPGTVEFIGENGEIMVACKDSRKTFCFNKIFGPSATQGSVYLDTQPLIRSVLDGYNVCIFAYGQTGSGKTYTMSGPDNLTEETWGVNYRALHDLFAISTDRKDLFKYEIVVQFLEIYNEHLRDLLAADSGSKKLEIRNCSQKNGINVPDATMMPVNSTNDVLQLMKLGQKNRSVGSTAMNERSSRSHSVLTVHVRGTDLVTGTVLHGSLHLVDLAGSERVDKSEATGERLKEAQFINKSLAALGDVIAALSVKSSHVPYRNSKLTQLLQDSLGGQAKALMFVHMSPDIESYSETLSTLKFAERVATVELGAARSNRESGNVRDLKDQVATLKDAVAKRDAEIEKLKSGIAPKPKVKSTPLRGPIGPECVSLSGEWQLRTEDSSHSCTLSPEDDIFESCLSSDSGKEDAPCPPLMLCSSPGRPTPQRILQDKVLNSKSTLSSTSGIPKLKTTEVSASQRLLRKSAYLKASLYSDQNSELGARSPGSIRKPQSGQQWRTPLQAQKLRPSDPRLSCGDQLASSRRLSTVGLPADCSSVKRSSLGSKESSATEGSKPAFARHLFANPTAKPAKS